MVADRLTSSEITLVADRQTTRLRVRLRLRVRVRVRGLNLLFASTSAGANRSYYGSSYTSINIYSRFSSSPYGYYTLAV